jgi:hypothetical protein
MGKVAQKKAAVTEELPAAAEKMNAQADTYYQGVCRGDGGHYAWKRIGWGNQGRSGVYHLEFGGINMAEPPCSEGTSKITKQR